jgi:hypothetical protein
MLVMKVAIHSRPVMVPSVRSDISVRRADVADCVGEGVDMPTPLGRWVRTAAGATGGTVNAGQREPLDHLALFRGEAQADHTVLN